jgi:hypothetical protein
LEHLVNGAPKSMGLTSPATTVTGAKPGPEYTTPALAGSTSSPAAASAE